jgi:hypothetical protein
MPRDAPSSLVAPTASVLPLAESATAPPKKSVEPTVAGFT